MRLPARPVTVGLLLLATLAPALAGGQPPDLGEALGPLDEAMGQVVPPAMNATYAALGQNITREDVRMWLWANMTKGEVGVMGILLGSGRAEVQASLHGRLEMRVISSDRVRAALEGRNAYNISAENATFLSQAYLPAEVFRASLTAEAIAAFQESQEAALAGFLGRTLPEMDILTLDFTWSNVSPLQSFGDASLTEPPIVLELDLVVQYVRLESLRTLVESYLESEPDPSKDRKKDYVRQLKADNGEPLRARDFFAAAAYTQLLNLSMQPGWSLDLSLRLAPGYSFTYFNEEVDQDGERGAKLHLDALTTDEEVHKVFLASATHRKAVALGLLAATWVVGLLLAFPVRFAYVRLRLPRLKP